MQLLDVTIGYPGVPYGKYPQEWYVASPSKPNPFSMHCGTLLSHSRSRSRATPRYGLGSIFFRSVPPPTVHIHLHLYTDLSSPSSPIPSLRTPQLAHPSRPPTPGSVPADMGVASPEEARAFELWLRGVWTEKEKRLGRFMKTDQRFVGDGGEQAREVVPIRQV